MSSLRKIDTSRELEKWRLPKSKTYLDRLSGYKGAFSLKGIVSYLDDLKKRVNSEDDEKRITPETFNLTIQAFIKLINCQIRHQLDNGRNGDFLPGIKDSDIKKVDVFMQRIRAKRISIQSKAIGREKVLSHTQMERLFDALENRYSTAKTRRGEKLKPLPRQIAFAKFLWWTGARVSEAVNISIADCKKVGDFWEISIIGKGSKARMLKIPDFLYSEITSVYNSTTYLFEAKQSGKKNNVGDNVKRPISRIYALKMIKQIDKKLNEYGIKKNITPHTFRHSFATHMISQGVPVKSLADYLGHSDPAITNRTYVHTQLTGDDLVKVMMGERIA